jgi:hypothetical protein
MLDRLPSVLVTKNRNELKVYQNNVVYLNNGDNFELRFFNPLQEKIGIEIMFNGTRKGDGFLVLNPGQDLILDRFLDEQRKMLFETYVVDGNNKQAVEAIQQNGVISFNFYKEHYSYSRMEDVNVNYNFPPKPFVYKSNFKKTKSMPHFGNSRGVQGCAGPNGPTGVCGAAGSTNTFASFSTTNSNSRMYSSNITHTSSVDFEGMMTPGVFTTESDLSLVETGRIEMGDVSSQTLKTVNAQFSNVAFYSIQYKMLPFSEMNRTSNEIRQYCGFCSYRLRKSNWLYCPKCGNKLD